MSIFILKMLSGCQNSPETMLKETTHKFSVLTYNVKGLPDGITESDTENNMRLIGELLNSYDIAVVQEDFAYHPQLISKATHEFKSTPKGSAGPVDFGDGLNHLSKYEFRSLQRVEWDTCSNAEAADCLATKGFSVAELLFGNVSLDLYNLHMDAGSAGPDIRTRQVQIAQLIDAIKTRSAGKAIIVAGDFNLDIENREQDLEMFERLLRETSLNDACEVNSCRTELVDRILFRDTEATILTCDSWKTDPTFVDGMGKNLSDHLAVAVTFTFQPRSSSASAFSATSVKQFLSTALESTISSGKSTI